VFQINDLVGLFTNVEAGSLKASKNPGSLDKWQNGGVTKFYPWHLRMQLA
jgi:hypothetical protein